MIKEPWEECPEVWKSQSAYFQWIRGQMRKAWSRHPVKNKFIRANRFKAALGKKGPKNPDGMMVWCGVCNDCHGTYTMRKLQVDHINSAGSFRGWDDFTTWMMGLMHINVDGLQFMCKECHDTKTYADKHGLSTEAAVIEKHVIWWCKHTSVDAQKLFLQLQDLPLNNAAARRSSYRQYCYLKGLLNEK